MHHQSYYFLRNCCLDIILLWKQNLSNLCSETKSDVYDTGCEFSLHRMGGGVCARWRKQDDDRKGEVDWPGRSAEKQKEGMAEHASLFLPYVNLISELWRRCVTPMDGSNCHVHIPVGQMLNIEPVCD